MAQCGHTAGSCTVSVRSNGFDAPAKGIADLAGIGTLNQHFLRRSDLIVAVLQQQIDACASAATTLSADHESWGALTT